MSTNSRANDTQVQIGFDGNHYPLSNLVMVDLEKIDSNPYQPREEITLESVSDLARGIALKRRTLPQTCGLMQVPIARRIGDRVELAFGHRRNLAFEFNLENDGQYDWSRMPLNLQELSDEEMYDFACRENSDRQDLNDIERALAIRRGIDDFGWTLSQAANANGLSKSAGSNLLTLLLLPDAVQESVRMGHLGQRHARELARLMKHDPPLENVCERLETMARREAWTAVQVQDAVNEELKQAERESFRETRYCQKCGQGREFTGIEMDGPAYVTCESCQWQHNAIAWLPYRPVCVDCDTTEGPFWVALDENGYHIYEGDKPARRCESCLLKYHQNRIKKEYGEDGIDCPRCGQAIFPVEDVRPNGSIRCDSCGNTYFNFRQLQQERQEKDAAEAKAEATDQDRAAGVFEKWQQKKADDAAQLQAASEEEAQPVDQWWLHNKAGQPSTTLPQEGTQEDTQPDQPQGEFDCPRCGREKIVKTNGGAWCLGCDARWDSKEAFDKECGGDVIPWLDIQAERGERVRNAAREWDAWEARRREDETPPLPGKGFDLANLRIDANRLITELIDLIYDLPEERLVELGQRMEELLGVFRENSPAE